MKSWKVPSVIFALLILALVFRWGDLGSTTNNGITLKTKIDHWNGSVWQTTIKNGSYSEKIVSPSWFEALRKPIEKQIEVQESDYSKPLPKDPNLKYQFKQYETVTKTKTIYESHPHIYWLSSNGLIKIWIYVALVVGLWLIVAVVAGKRKIWR